DRLVDGAFQARDAVTLMICLGRVIGQRLLERSLLELQLHHPLVMLVGPRTHSLRWSASSTQQEFQQSLTRAPFVGFRSLPRSNKISKGLVLGIRHPHGRQVPSAEQPRQLLCVAPVGL